MSASRWAESLRLYPVWVVPEPDQHGRHGLNERRRPAHKARGLHVRGEALRGEIVDLDPPRRHRPTLRRSPGEYVRDLDAVVAGRRMRQLAGVIDLSRRTNRIHQAKSRLAVRRPSGSDHRHERNDPGATADK